MDLSQLIDALSDPAAYPANPAEVEVVQTHISVVFLAGEWVYKIKKPVQLGFVDFSTIEKRRYFCEEEVRLNARLAPEVYLGVVPVGNQGGKVQVEADSQAVEWAVKMRRLPEEATLESRLARGEVDDALMADVARRIAEFHAQAEAGERIAAFGRFDVVAGNARDNFEQSRDHIGQTISAAVFDRLRARTDEVLSDQRALIENRARRGVPRDTHGDLRLDHVYVVEENAASRRLLIIDCVEFNEGFRYADPVSDVAFLAMDLKYAGRRDLARAFSDAYFDASGDGEGRALLSFYTAYRAAVRGKVEGLKQAEPEVPEEDRALARVRARGYWLLALGELEPPERRPCLVLVAGLPGSGKSTLAAALNRHGDYHVVRSDVVRKELAGLPAEATAAGAFGTGIYSPEWSERTYGECLRRAEARLFEGQRVILDASFREESHRAAFLEAARRWNVPAVLLVCHAEPETIRSRLAARSGDVSDADWSIHQAAARAWEPLSSNTKAATRIIPSEGALKHTQQCALTALRAFDIER